ncbi:hypothetical protein ACVWZV_008746 [Bradyrhizobium sp. GM5.1]
MITLTREQASERAQNEAGRAIAEERKITAAAREVAGILAQAGIEVKMPHLERRLKSHASMTDQLTGMSIPPSSAPQLFSNAVRHVLEIPDKDFTRAFKKAMLAFEERDYTERQTTNWFRMRSPTFVGIKTVLTTADSLIASKWSSTRQAAIKPSLPITTAIKFSAGCGGNQARMLWSKLRPRNWCSGRERFAQRLRSLTARWAYPTGEPKEIVRTAPLRHLDCELSMNQECPRSPGQRRQERLPRRLVHTAQNQGEPQLLCGS